MKQIYLVKECSSMSDHVLMAFDNKEDAEKMAEINNWDVKEVLLVEANKAQVNFRNEIGVPFPEPPDYQRK